MHVTSGCRDPGCVSAVPTSAAGTTVQHLPHPGPPNVAEDGASSTAWFTIRALRREKLEKPPCTLQKAKSEMRGATGAGSSANDTLSPCLAGRTKSGVEDPVSPGVSDQSDSVIALPFSQPHSSRTRIPRLENCGTEGAAAGDCSPASQPGDKGS